ncbi:MAG: hypothetical protein HGA67_00075 [Candidatus Yonathbacteria bacterium]|nr:hypothetical protein [Candidatus Yonathbacteria bacterium]
MQSRKHLIKHTRAEKRKEQTRILKRRIILFACMAVTLTGVLAWGSGMSQISIADVRVEGTMLADAGAIKANVEHNLEGRYGYLFSKRNILLFSKKAIIADVLASFHRIEVVTLGHDAGNILVVTVTERKPSLVWCPAPVSDDIVSSGTISPISCYFTDRDGIIYAPAPTFSAPVFFTWYGPLLDAARSAEGNRFLSPDEFATVSGIVEEIKRAGIKPLSGTIGVEDIRMATGTIGDVIFKRGQNASEVVNNLTAARKAIPSDVLLEYVDLRFGTKVFYKEKEVEHVMNVSG